MVVGGGEVVMRDVDEGGTRPGRFAKLTTMQCDVTGKE